jgi:hypothetical protein
MRKVLAAVAAAVVFVPADAVVARNNYIPVPAKYRFTGVVGTIASPASHAIFVGDGISFSFTDKGTPPVKTYRVCVYKLHFEERGAATKCWRRRISRRNFNRDRFTVLSLPIGQAVSVEWVAKWYAAGRVVASWRFIYLLEGE